MSKSHQSAGGRVVAGPDTQTGAEIIELPDSGESRPALSRACNEMVDELFDASALLHALLSHVHQLADEGHIGDDVAANDLQRLLRQAEHRVTQVAERLLNLPSIPTKEVHHG